MAIEILLKLQRRLIFANVIPLHFSFLEIWSHLLKKSLNEKFVFCAVFVVLDYNIECVIFSILNLHHCSFNGYF